MNQNRNLDSAGVQIAGLPPNAFAPPPEKVQAQTVPRHSANPETKIFVKSNFKQSSDGGNCVAFYERNEAHPNDAEAFVSGDKPTLIALTESANEALNLGKILQCSDGEVLVYQAEKLSRARKFVATKKELARQKFIELTGDDKGFSAAWDESIRAKTALQAIEEIL
jgi:hypothetical protein